MQAFARRVAAVKGLFAAGLVGASLLAAGGCTTVAETYTYESDSLSPKTLSIIDTSTGEKVWTCDVPVGQKLEMRFANRVKQAEEKGHDELAWTLSGIDSKSKGRKSTVKVPPVSHRRLDMTLRPTPETR